MLDPGTLVAYARQLDAPQLAHLASAGICLWFGLKCPPRERVAFWAMSAFTYAVLGWAGYRFGVYGLPTSYRVPAAEAYLYKPITGVELREIDHVLQLLLAAVFGSAALVCAWAEGFLARGASALRELLAATGARAGAQDGSSPL